MTHQLILRDRAFDVTEASISGVLPDPYWCDTYNHGRGKGLVFGIDIKTSPRIIDDERWAPHPYYERLALPRRDWRSFEGHSIRWDEPFDAVADEMNGGFYVWEHADILRAELRFGRREGPLFDVAWEGACNVHWDEADFGTNVPFSLTAAARLTTITVHGSEGDDAVALRARLAMHLDLGDFEQGELKHHGAYESRVGMRSCTFRLKPN